MGSLGVVAGVWSLHDDVGGPGRPPQLILNVLIYNAKIKVGHALARCDGARVESENCRKCHARGSLMITTFYV